MTKAQAAKTSHARKEARKESHSPYPDENGVRKAPPGSKPSTPASPEDARRQAVKAARADLRELLAFIIDLQVPGHGDKQSGKVLDAIDALIRARAAGGGAPVEEPADIIDLETIIAQKMRDFFEPMQAQIRKETELQVQDLLDKATAPQTEAPPTAKGEARAEKEQPPADLGEKKKDAK